MKQVLTVDVSDDVYEALREQSAKTGKPIREIASEWMAEHSRPAKRGSVDALMPFYGAWRMAPGERARIEQMIQAERHQEEGNG
ncbi:MAG: hypothetical protein FJ279_03360 [Planctomycetes bacterium]|nr:hypothetical protein [Planctomycetota bacterium]MBM4081739.1 hypothetical protein [Planctomycetota bacterium]